VSSYHTSVLLKETVDGLNVKKNAIYIDCTLGAGGHTTEIIKRGGVVLGIDVDTDALDYVKENFKSEISENKLKLAQGNFKDIEVIAKKYGYEKINGILFDLGVSSHQLDTAQRGFSFSKDAPLDMRMDKSFGATARDLVNGLNKGELYELFTKLGEEVFAKSISNGIVRARELKPIETTGELAEIVARAYPRGVKKISPATKVFQALRIAVNDELNNLKEALPKSNSLLEKNGRLVVITFHSLEDRIVKDEFLRLEKENLGKIITHKPIIPTDEEAGENRRSRSSKLRIFER
jgi:16S rRNA (cytosine1402-N4)-methyltransferase